jgi:hypothetical protein
MRAGKMRAMTAEVTPIMETDMAAVADFLHDNFNDRIPWAQACSVVPWKVEAPNFGFMLRDEQRVVGALLTLYSERLVAGQVERFCNLGTWYVLPDYRSRSMSLLTAVLAQKGYHFTVLTPDKGPLEILDWLKFRFLDTSAALIPNLPWPTVPGRTRISADQNVIERTLTGTDLEIYRDHASALGTHHLVLIRGQDSCHVMFREFRYKDAPLLAVVLHVSNPDLFHRALIPLTRHLLVRHRLVSTLAELRMIKRKPPLAFLVNSWPKMYRSASLEPEQIDYLYSELECVPF